MRTSEVTLELVLAAFLSLKDGDHPEKNVRSYRSWSRNVRVKEVRQTKRRAPIRTVEIDRNEPVSTSDYYELSDRVLPPNSSYTRQ